jgi:hypothetical protein
MPAPRSLPDTLRTTARTRAADVAGEGDPTNNTGERALRPAVLWRKGSSRGRRDAGKRFVERILTVAATCRQRGRSLFTQMTSAEPPALGHRPRQPRTSRGWE